MAKIIKLKSKKNTAIKDGSEDAASMAHYQELIKENPLDQKAYNRLMILYRKEKDYKKELQIINTAIRSFDAFHKSHKKKANKTIQTISKKLNRSLGLVDSKGKTTYDIEPVAGWKKRKEVVMKKMR